MMRGYTARQRLLGNAEPLEQPRIPIHGADIPQQRARSVGRIGQQRLFLEQPEQQKTGERSHGEVSFAPGRRHRRQMIEAPAQLGSAVMRREHQARTPLDFIRLCG